MTKKALLLIVLLIKCSMCLAQQGLYGDMGIVSVQSDTSLFSSDRHIIRYQNEQYLFFTVNPAQKVYVITLFPSPGVKNVQLLSSQDFDIIDSLVLIDKSFYKAKIEFSDIGKVFFPRLVFACESSDGKRANKEVKLYPYMQTSVQGVPENTDIFVGEELTVNLPSSNPENVQVIDTWQNTREMDYRIVRENNKLSLQVRPYVVGAKELTLNLKTIRPYLDKSDKTVNTIPAVKINFTIKPSRLNFINFSKSEFFLDLASSSMEEIQIDYNRNFNLKQIYRIEDKDESGGKLVAELFTQSHVGNSNKILCYLRTYSLHRAGTGYLYIKEGNSTRFITNFNVFEKPKIEKVSLQREGEEWTTNLTVFPGEKVEIRVEGTGLLRASVKFGQCEARPDTVRRSDNVIFYFIKIPENIADRKTPVYLNDRISTYELLVKEHQVPRDLDFVSIDYEGKSNKITSKMFNKPILYRDVIKDINLTFQPELIDQNGKFFGKQYLVIETKIFNAKGELKEFQSIDNIVICPGENSSRYRYYDLKDCRRNAVNLNDYLSQKTYDQEGWSRIEITVKQKETRYSLPVYSRKIVLIKEKKVALDLQVSFPAGMLVKRFNQPGIGNLTGISTAVIAQFSFYDPERIGRLKPYNIGVGFIAVDAFNFSNTSQNKDLGVVVLGSLYPVRKEKKISFPIFAGAGYLLKNNTVFLVFGPGVQLNF